LNAQDIVIFKTLIVQKILDNFEALPLRPFETDVMPKITPIEL